MGHDICAYLGDADPTNPLEELRGWDELPSVTYLRRNSWDRWRHTLYEVLGVEKYDGDYSGVGAGQWFNRGQLEAALTRLRERLVSGQKVQPEIDFVQSCLAALPPDRTMLFIGFG